MQNPPFVITNADHRTCGPPMKISQLRNLTVVIEAGTVRQAAKHLNLSQSSVTKSIQQLEETLGVELLRRSSHGVMPTEAGRALVARAKVIDAELRHARNDIDAIRGANFGGRGRGPRETWSTFLDPSLNPPEIRPWGSKALINACMDFRHIKSFSPRTKLDKKTYERVVSRWSELGLAGKPPEIRVFEEKRSPEGIA